MGSLGLARFGYTMILPSMQEGLDLSNTEAGALATGNFIGYLCFALIAGFMASHFSPRRVISLSLLGVGITLILTGLSYSFTSALILRTLTGIGSGGSNVPIMGLMAAWFAPRRRGLATGLAVGGSSLGLVLTGAFVPGILDASPENGWRHSWFFLGGLVVLIAIVAYIVLRDRPEQKSLSAIGAEPNPPGDAPAAVARGIRSWGLVVGSGVVWKLAAIYFAFGFAYIIYVTFFAKFLQSEVGFSKEAAGRLWQIVGWTSIFCGLIWGWVSDVIGRKKALIAVYCIQALAYVVFALWRAPVGLGLSTLLFGLTAWSIPAIMASACGDRLGPKMASAALGFITLFMGIGQALGPYVAGRIADASGTFVWSFILAAAMSLVGAAATLTLREKAKGK